MKPLARDAEALVLTALQLDPKQPLARHIHIHLAEAASPLRWLPAGAGQGVLRTPTNRHVVCRAPPRGSLTSARAEESADAIAGTHGAWSHDMGHLLHMPAHLCAWARPACLCRPSAGA